METRERFWMRRSPSDGRWLTVDRAISTAQTYLDLDLTADLHRGTTTIFIDRTARGGLSSRSRSDGLEGSQKNSTIVVRSNRDRDAIEPRSWGIWRDRGTRSLRRIVRRSWPSIPPHDRIQRPQFSGQKLGSMPTIGGNSTPKLGRIHCGFEATTPLKGNCSHDASNQVPRPPQLPTILG